MALTIWLGRVKSLLEYIYQQCVYMHIFDSSVSFISTHGVGLRYALQCLQGCPVRFSVLAMAMAPCIGAASVLVGIHVPMRHSAARAEPMDVYSISASEPPMNVPELVSTRVFHTRDQIQEARTT